MGGIADKHVEWAVVNRLKAMLDNPPKTKFNVTQSFALFSTILLWTKQRAWVPDRDLRGPLDHAARSVRAALTDNSIFDEPWLLSKTAPQLATIRAQGAKTSPRARINTDFEGMKAEQFIKWLRDALAHGDGRTISPIHKLGQRSNKTLLAGFKVVFPAAKRSRRNLTLSLYQADMKRIGTILANAFCTALSGGDRYFEQDAATTTIVEAA